MGWAVKGLAQYRKHGMGSLSQSVLDRRQEYVSEQDDVGRWIVESGDVEAAPSGIIAKSQAYLLYEQWCQAEAFAPMKSRTFNSRLKQRRGIGEDNTYIDGKRARAWTGLREAITHDKSRTGDREDAF